ncbi:MAG: hypothetical protein ACYTDV_18865 [Planctomycetota bacterium]
MGCTRWMGKTQIHPDRHVLSRSTLYINGTSRRRLFDLPVLKLRHQLSVQLSQFRIALGIGAPQLEQPVELERVEHLATFVML